MRWAWNTTGFASVGAGLAGIYVPGLPTTVFLIIALYCFAKGGNTKTRAWLLGHRTFGPVLTDWEETKSLTLRIKWIAVASIVVSCGISAAIVPALWVKAVILLTGAVGVWYVCSRKTKPAVVHKAEARA